jgi:uncharacterized protein (DUF433 family)
MADTRSVQLDLPLPDFLRDDGYGYVLLSGHRIGLVDVVYFYNQGYSAEMLVAMFPTIPLSLVHKVIAFYLENQAPVDQYVENHRLEMERQRASAAGKGPTLAELRERLRKRQQAKAS